MLLAESTDGVGDIQPDTGDITARDQREGREVWLIPGWCWLGVHPYAAVPCVRSCRGPGDWAQDEVGQGGASCPVAGGLSPLSWLCVTLVGTAPTSGAMSMTDRGV